MLVQTALYAYHTSDVVAAHRHAPSSVAPAVVPGTVPDVIGGAAAQASDCAIAGAASATMAAAAAVQDTIPRRPPTVRNRDVRRVSMRYLLGPLGRDLVKG